MGATNFAKPKSVIFRQPVAVSNRFSGCGQTQFRLMKAVPLAMWGESHTVRIGLFVTGDRDPGVRQERSADWGEANHGML